MFVQYIQQDPWIVPTFPLLLVLELWMVHHSPNGTNYPGILLYRSFISICLSAILIRLDKIKLNNHQVPSKSYPSYIGGININLNREGGTFTTSKEKSCKSQDIWIVVFLIQNDSTEIFFEKGNQIFLNNFSFRI